jgi:hypothetical protein
MRRALLSLAAILALPLALSAQVEIGLDAGLSITNPDDDDDNLVTFAIPGTAPSSSFLQGGAVRLGFPFAERFVFEPLVSFTRFDIDDEAYTQLTLIPGVVALFGEPDAVRFYLRGEFLFAYVSDFDEESGVQVGFGGAAGLRKPLGDAAFLRLEGGFDKVNENDDADAPELFGYKHFRVLVGLSAIIG